MKYKYMYLSLLTHLHGLYWGNFNFFSLTLLGSYLPGPEPNAHLESNLPLSYSHSPLNTLITSKKKSLVIVRGLWL